MGEEAGRGERKEENGRGMGEEDGRGRGRMRDQG